MATGRVQVAECNKCLATLADYDMQLKNAAKSPRVNVMPLKQWIDETRTTVARLLKVEQEHQDFDKELNLLVKGFTSFKMSDSDNTAKYWRLSDRLNKLNSRFETNPKFQETLKRLNMLRKLSHAALGNQEKPTLFSVTELFKTASEF